MTQVAVAPGHLSRTLLPLVTALPLQPQQDGNQTVSMKSGEVTQHSNENIQFKCSFMNFQSSCSSLIYFSDMEEQLLSFSCKRNIFI